MNPPFDNYLIPISKQANYLEALSNSFLCANRLVTGAPTVTNKDYEHLTQFILFDNILSRSKWSSWDNRYLISYGTEVEFSILFYWFLTDKKLTNSYTVHVIEPVTKHIDDYLNHFLPLETWDLWEVKNYSGVVFIKNRGDARNRNNRYVPITHQSA